MGFVHLSLRTSRSAVTSRGNDRVSCPGWEPRYRGTRTERVYSAKALAIKTTDVLQDQCVFVVRAGPPQVVEPSVVRHCMGGGARSVPGQGESPRPGLESVSVVRFCIGVVGRLVSICSLRGDTGEVGMSA